MSALIEFEEVCKYYQMGDTTVKAADHITMKIDKGEFVAIVGQSGSGKSTCMNIIGCLDVPTHGVYRLNGRDVGKMSRNELASVRNEMLGFIFQQYNLLPRLNLMENVEVPLVYAGVSRAERHARAREVLEQVGLGDKLKNRPNQLSGGQQQRVALARAIVTRPKVLLLDEPLSAIDAKLRKSLQVEIRRIQKQLNITTIFVTHDQDEALRGADFVYAKNWSAYEGDNYGKVLSRDRSWTVTKEKMALTDNAFFMHCLPVRRNMIVSDEVIESPRSLVIPEAANRVVSAQTVIKKMLESL